MSSMDRENNDDDYMSDLILQNISKNESELRKKLKKESSKKISEDLDPSDLKKEKRGKTIAALMAENRDYGSSIEISSQNKGRVLLEKLGYSGEGGIGKYNTGIAEPISIKSDSIIINEKKIGLGVLKAAKDAENNLLKKRKLELEMSENHQLNFISSQCQRFQSNMLDKNILKAEKILYNLDVQNDVEPHDLWPLFALAQNDEAFTDPNDLHFSTNKTDSNRLENLVARLNYLRSKYYYCLFCGCAYDDADELISSCPGIDEDSH